MVVGLFPRGHAACVPEAYLEQLVQHGPPLSGGQRARLPAILTSTASAAEAKLH